MDGIPSRASEVANSEKQEAEVPDTDWIRIDDYECHVDFPPDIAGRIRQSVRKLLWENGISRNLREAIARNITISTKGTWAGYQLEHVTVHTKLWCPFAAPTGLEAALNMRRKRTEFLFVLSIRPLLSDQDWTMVASNLYEAPPQLNDAAMDLRCWEPVEHRRADGLSKINTKRIREHLFADFDGYTTELIPDHVLWLLLFSSVGVLEFDIGEREANTDDCWLVQRVRKQFDPDCDGCGDAYDVAAAKEKWGSKVLEELEVEDHLDLQPSQVWDFLSKQGGAPAL
ncbi:hypothetical protein DFJ74DRAFT_646109 [Hyaloraphidium curvatum]|nr:hypothetical protein DFJ74DRAFT_646109 [Hyaloraphidium curvatum]